MNTEDKTVREEIEEELQEVIENYNDEEIVRDNTDHVLSLLRKLIHEAKPKKINSENTGITGIYDDVYPKGFNDGTNEYEQSLLEKIGGEYIWHEEKK